MEIVSVPEIDEIQAQVHITNIEEKFSNITFETLFDYIQISNNGNSVRANLSDILEPQEIDFLDSIGFLKTPYTHRGKETGFYHIDQQVAKQFENINIILQSGRYQEKGDLGETVSCMQQRNILSRLDEHLSLFKADSNGRQIWEYIKEHPGSNNTDISVNTGVSDSTNGLIMHLNRNGFIETEKEGLGKNREHSFTDRGLAYQEFHDKYHQQIRAINHDIRREIVEYLSDENSVKNVNSICENVGLRQSVASQQLKILLDAGLVHNKRNASDARMIIYSIDTANLTSFSNELEEFLKGQTDSE